MRLAMMNRKLHRWGALIASLPLLLIVVTGILLQFKKEADWIQPPTQTGTGHEPSLSFDSILEIAKGVPGSGIAAWDDIDRLDVRPGDGVVKVRSKNSLEIQIDAATGEVLLQQVRRSDLIEDLHDGSFFHRCAKHWIFFPIALILIGLWLTGVYIFFLPYVSRKRRNNGGIR